MEGTVEEAIFRMGENSDKVGKLRRKSMGSKKGEDEPQLTKEEVFNLLSLELKDDEDFEEPQ